MKTARCVAAHVIPRVVLSLLFTLLGTRAETNAPFINPNELSGGVVKVEILEGLPDQPTWNFTNPPVAETYTEQVLAFPRSR